MIPSNNETPNDLESGSWANGDGQGSGLDESIGNGRGSGFSAGGGTFNGSGSGNGSGQSMFGGLSEDGVSVRLAGLRWPLLNRDSSSGVSDHADILESVEGS